MTSTSHQNIDGADPPQSEKKFLLDTESCKIPDIDADDNAILDKIRPGRKINCSDGGLYSITYLDDAVLRVKNVYGDRFNSCTYQPIFRETDFKSTLGDPSRAFTDFMEIPPLHEFIKTTCFVQNIHQNATDEIVNYHALVPLKDAVENRCENDFSKHRNRPEIAETFNVQMLGIDSVSTISFRRFMARTKTFLDEELNAFEMSVHSKVADNTFVNLIPVTMGVLMNEMNPPYDESTNSHREFDVYNFIWNDFSRAGYRTHYAEDTPGMGTFWLYKKGFSTPPADYYMRPLTLPMCKDKSFRRGDCFADRTDTRLYLDYLSDFSNKFKDKPRFGFTFLTRLTHDTMGRIGSADYEYVDFLKRYKDDGHFNNTVLIFFSDHGSRVSSYRETSLGKMEERLPFLYFVFPDWFNDKYPHLAKNLRTNSKRFTTHFDLYETLKELLHFDGTDKKSNLKTRGISLLREIPEERSCEDAGILPHWCLCNVEENVDINSNISHSIADGLVVHINDYLAPVTQKCAQLAVHNVSSVVRKQSNSKEQLSTTGKTQLPDTYQVTLTTTPGLGLFEATLTYDLANNDVKVNTGSISRINLYGNQSHCIDTKGFAKFCYCLPNQ